MSVGAAYDARASEYIALLGDIAQTDARDRALIAAWRDATPGRLLDAASESRPRVDGEPSIRPHASLTATRA